MARIFLGTDLGKRTITANIPAGTTIANRRVICELSNSMVLVEKPVSGGFGKVVYETRFGDEVGGATLTADGYNGEVMMWPQYRGAHVYVTALDTGALVYPYLSRQANEFWYETSEDGARMQRVQYLGLAAADSTTTFVLDGQGDYLVMTVNRSGGNSSGYRTLWAVMTQAGAGITQRLTAQPSGSGIDNMTVNALQLAVTVNGQAPVKIYALKLGDV